MQGKKSILKQAINFFMVSGIGWIIDMIIYSIISNFISVQISNIISSAVSVTYVYIVSTKRIFENNKSFNLKTKYIFYITYQIAMILISAFIIGIINDIIISEISIELIINYSKIFSKILVTPFTMVMNFIFMKLLMEKI